MQQSQNYQHQQKLGHRRRPSIGKSMPVTSLLLNFPPSNESKSYNSLSRDGLSPEEKPPLFFQISEINEDEPQNQQNIPNIIITDRNINNEKDIDDINFCHKSKIISICDHGNSNCLISKNSDDRGDLINNHNKNNNIKSEELYLIKGSDRGGCYISCEMCKNENCFEVNNNLSSFKDLCNKLCNSTCKQENNTNSINNNNCNKDFEDFDKNLSLKQFNTMTRSCLKVPQSSSVVATTASSSSSSKIDQQRRNFLKEMLNKSGSAGANNDQHDQCERCIKMPNENERNSDENIYNEDDDEVEECCKPVKDIILENFNIKDFREKFAIAEALAKTSMMTSPAAKRRIAARKIEMELDYPTTKTATLTGTGSPTESDDDMKEFIPPRQLLLYLVRMGSFNSAPKINNTDSQDDSFEVPQGLTVVDFLQHCKVLRGENRPQLLTRYFLKPIINNAIISNDITEGLRVLKLNAVSKVCSAPVTSPKHLRIFQWNILSQSLGQNNDGFICCPDEALTWENRKYLIVEEIMQNNPDVICLQEVDHFKFLERVLGSQNYCGIFLPKPDSPCMYIQDNNGPDGCAIFYKRDKFDLINFDTRILEVWRVQSNQVAIAANLRVIETDKEICVCTTHLKARNGALLSKLRNEQGKDLLRFVNSVGQKRPIILCGDFNAEPIEPVYSTVLNYKTLGLSSAYADINMNGNEIDNNINSYDMKKNNNYSNNDDNDDQQNEEVVKTDAEISALNEPPYTTWKIREEGEVCHTIDYVFYSKKNLKINNCLSFPQENEIGETRTPSFQYPSDHFSLVCDFEILDDCEKLSIIK